VTIIFSSVLTNYIKILLQNPIHQKSDFGVNNCNIKQSKLSINSIKLTEHPNNENKASCSNLVKFDGPLKSLKIQRQPPSFVHNKKFSCDICKKGVGTKGGLIYHMKVHLFGKPFKCEICSRYYATKNDFDTHYKRHSGQTFNCDLCSRKCKTKQYIADHISSVHLPKVVPCTQCKKLFASKGVLKKHVNMNHKRPAKLKRFLCKLCDTYFLKKTYEKHCFERELFKYKCDVCLEKFTCNKLLAKQRKREKEAQYHCKMCNNTVKNVKMHLFYHHGNYQCDICPFKTNKHALRLTHLKTCGTEDQIRSLGHHCEICDQYFRTKFILDRHKHGQHGKFKCCYCSIKFFSLFALKKHEKSFHGKYANTPIFTCVLCPRYKNFTKKEGFDNHFYVQHTTLNSALDGKGRARGGYVCDKCRFRSWEKIRFKRHVSFCYKKC